MLRYSCNVGKNLTELPFSLNLTQHFTCKEEKKRIQITKLILFHLPMQADTLAWENFSIVYLLQLYVNSIYGIFNITVPGLVLQKTSLQQLILANNEHLHKMMTILPKRKERHTASCLPLTVNTNLSQRTVCPDMT